MRPTTIKPASRFSAVAASNSAGRPIDTTLSHETPFLMVAESVFRRASADEIDFIIGAMALSSLWLHLAAADVVSVLGFTFVAHIIVNHVAFRLGIRDTKW
jgi:hypothetical protein